MDQVPQYTITPPLSSLNCVYLEQQTWGRNWSDIITFLTHISQLRDTRHPEHMVKPEMNISQKNQYFFTDPKNGPARESRSPWLLASNISARSPKKTIFLHILVIFLHGPPKKRNFMHNWIRNSLNLHYITLFIVLPSFPWFKGPFELPFSNTYH